MMRPRIILVLSLLSGLSSSNPTTTEISKDVNEMHYFYFPSDDQKFEILFNNKYSLEASNMTAGEKTVIIVDGFLSDVTSPMNTITKQSYINLEGNNVIVVDWGKLSGSGLPFGNDLETAGAYLTVVGNVDPVGRRLGEFINFLQENKQIQFSDFTIVGHSLGAHIGGAAGVAVRNYYNSLIGRIVGLDPAGPLFSYQVSPDKRLHSGQASFVDIYHTSRGNLGDSDQNTADVNIYVNGGQNQPGCQEADNSTILGFCSHTYSWKFYNAAFNTDTIEACPCYNSTCVCTSCEFECNNGIHVGPNVYTSARGPYHVTLGPL